MIVFCYVLPASNKARDDDDDDECPIGRLIRYHRLGNCAF